MPNPAGGLTGTCAAMTVTGLRFGLTGIQLGTPPTRGHVPTYNGPSIVGAPPRTNPMTAPGGTMARPSRRLAHHVRRISVIPAEARGPRMPGQKGKGDGETENRWAVPRGNGHWSSLSGAGGREGAQGR